MVCRKTVKKEDVQSAVIRKHSLVPEDLAAALSAFTGCPRMTAKAPPTLVLGFQINYKKAKS